VLLIIGIAGYAYLDHYQPLASGALGRSDTAYEDGAPFSYAYWLINQGSLPVTARSVTPPDGASWFERDPGVASISLGARVRHPSSGSSPPRVRRFEDSMDTDERFRDQLPKDRPGRD